jgi:hypothetical protein
VPHPPSRAQPARLIGVCGGRTWRALLACLDEGVRACVDRNGRARRVVQGVVWSYRLGSGVFFNSKPAAKAAIAPRSHCIR